LDFDPEGGVKSGRATTLESDHEPNRSPHHEELPQYGLGGDFDIIRDKPQSFSVKIEGDRLHQSGTLSNGLKIEEVWERCKKQ